MADQGYRLIPRRMRFAKKPTAATMNRAVDARCSLAQSYDGEDKRRDSGQVKQACDPHAIP